MGAGPVRGARRAILPANPLRRMRCCHAQSSFVDRRLARIARHRAARVRSLRGAGAVWRASRGSRTFARPCCRFASARSGCARVPIGTSPPRAGCTGCAAEPGSDLHRRLPLLQPGRAILAARDARPIPVAAGRTDARLARSHARIAARFQPCGAFAAARPSDLRLTFPSSRTAAARPAADMPLRAAGNGCCTRTPSGRST